MVSAPMTDALTCDQFLGGKITLCQPAKGYRAGVDPVLLAASVRARAGQSVLDLGCGVGAGALCLGARIAGLSLAGLELQPHYAALARRNATTNRIALDVFEGDLTDMPAALKARQFDHVIMNPPYFDRAKGSAAPDPTREVALGGGEVPLARWIEAGAKRLAPKGYLTLIQRAARVPEILAAATPHLGSLQLLPLVSRAGRDSRLVLLRARKDGRAAFRLHDGLRMHEGEAHENDEENYSTAVRAVLRSGAALPFPD